MKIKKRVLLISIAFMLISLFIILNTGIECKLNSIGISVFAGCIVSSCTLFTEYQSNKQAIKNTYYNLMIYYYSFLLQYNNCIEQCINNNEQLLEKMLEYYSVNLNSLYSNILSIDDSIYEKNKEYQELKMFLNNTSYAVSNNSRVLDILIKEKVIDDYNKYNCNKASYTSDFKAQFDELYISSSNKLKYFEEKFITIIDKKQRKQFEESKLVIKERLKNYKYERKIL